jgi:D-alanyl-D-alanine endopeptidase (penicillin-binding protein 7)
MPLELTLANVAAWSVQAGVLALAAAALSRLAPVEQPNLRLAYGQALLVLVVGLPVLQPWRRAAVEPAWSFAITRLGASEPLSGSGASPSAPAWSALVAVLLLAGVVWQLARLGAGLARIRSLRRRGRPWDPPAWLASLRDELAPRARFVLSDETSAPGTFGIRHATIVLPAAFEAMDRERQSAIAAHELLHARRHDWLFLLFEELLKAVLFFHPAVHWLVGRIRLAREQAVDAAVVRRLGGREAYLASLVEVARIGVRARALPAAPFLGKSHLRERVDLLLKEVVMSRARTRIHAALSAGALVLAAAWAVSAAPLHSAPSAVPGSPASLEGEPKASIPRLVHKVNPVYPEAAKADKAEGTFELALVVGRDGAVRDARVVASSSTPGRLEDKTALDGDARLAEAAVAAVKQWRYEPVEKNGKPVEVQMAVTVVFRL